MIDNKEIKFILTNSFLILLKVLASVIKQEKELKDLKIGMKDSSQYVFEETV